MRFKENSFQEHVVAHPGEPRTVRNMGNQPRIKRTANTKARNNALVITPAMVVISAILAGCGNGVSAPQPLSQSLSPVAAVTRNCQVAFPQTQAQWSKTLDGHLEGGQAFSADGSIALRMDEHTVVWLWADTFKGDVVGKGMTGAKMTSSSVTIQEDGCMYPVNGEIIESAGNVGHWPASAVAYEGGKVVLFMGRVLHYGTDFQVVASEVVTGHLDKNQGLVLEKTSTIDEKLGEYDVHWGSGSAIHGKDLYVWGTQRVRGDFGRQVVLAKTTPQTVHDKNTWEYWDGKEWTKDSRHLGVLIQAVGGTDADLTVEVDSKGAVKFISKKDGAMGEKVHMWTASTASGKYTDTGKVADVGGWAQGGSVSYSARLQPGLQVTTDKGPQPLATVNHNYTGTEYLKKVSEDRSTYLPTVINIKSTKSTVIKAARPTPGR